MAFFGLQVYTRTICAAQAKQKDVIDLTGNPYEADLSRALAMSLDEDTQKSSEAVFRPSTRAPDPDWAMVPSNVRSNKCAHVARL